MKRTLGSLIILFFGVGFVLAGHHGWESRSDDESNSNENSPVDFNAVIDMSGAFMTGGDGSMRRPRPGPGPRPRLPRFFVGSFRSAAKRDWQINMWNIYNATGFPTEYVNEDMKIIITDQRNGSFRYCVFAGNETINDLVFQLNKPISVNGTNTSIEGQYTFKTLGKRSVLSIWSNSSSFGLSRADMQFGGADHSSGVDVVYRVLGQDMTGARHFRVMRKPSKPPTTTVDPILNGLLPGPATTDDDSQPPTDPNSDAADDSDDNIAILE